MGNTIASSSVESPQTGAAAGIRVHPAADHGAASSSSASHHASFAALITPPLPGEIREDPSDSSSELDHSRSSTGEGHAESITRHIRDEDWAVTLASFSASRNAQDYSSLAELAEEREVPWKQSIKPFLPSTSDESPEPISSSSSSSSVGSAFSSGSFAFIELYTSHLSIPMVDIAFDEITRLSRQRPELRLYPMAFHITTANETEGKEGQPNHQSSVSDPLARAPFTQRYHAYAKRLYEDTHCLSYPPQVLINGVREASAYHRKTIADHIRTLLDPVANPPIPGVFFEIALPAVPTASAISHDAPVDDASLSPGAPSADLAELAARARLSPGVGVGEGVSEPTSSQVSPTKHRSPAEPAAVEVQTWNESDFETESDEEEDQDELENSPSEEQKANDHLSLVSPDPTDALSNTPSASPETPLSEATYSAVAPSQRPRRRVRRVVHDAPPDPSTSVFIGFQIHLPPDAPKSMLQLHFALLERDMHVPIQQTSPVGPTHVQLRHPVVREIVTQPLRSLTINHGRATLPIPEDAQRTNCFVVAWVQQRHSLRIIAVDSSSLPPLLHSANNSAPRMQDIAF